MQTTKSITNTEKTSDYQRGEREIRGMKLRYTNYYV